MEMVDYPIMRSQQPGPLLRKKISTQKKLQTNILLMKLFQTTEIKMNLKFKILNTYRVGKVLFHEKKSISSFGGGGNLGHYRYALGQIKNICV